MRAIKAHTEIHRCISPLIVLRSSACSDDDDEKCLQSSSISSEMRFFPWKYIPEGRKQTLLLERCAFVALISSVDARS